MGNLTLSVLMLFYSVRNMIFNRNVNTLILMFFLLTLLHVICIVFIFQYIDMLKTTNCKCSESIIRDIMYVYNIIETISLVFLFIMVLSIVFFITNILQLKNDNNLNIKGEPYLKPKSSNLKLKQKPYMKPKSRKLKTKIKPK